MHRVLKAELIKCGITVAQIAQAIGISEKSMRNKINGETDFTFPEAQAIRNVLKSTLSLDDLFKTDDE